MPNEDVLKKEARANFESLVSELMPRPKRQHRRTKADHGLPPDEQLFPLAKNCVENQRKLWPDVAIYDLLQLPAQSVVREMVQNFKRRHRGNQIHTSAVQRFQRFCRALGSVYARCSCDNSSPASIRDQLVNALRRAKENVRFIPWEFVFANCSVSGRDSSRRGYRSKQSVST